MNLRGEITADGDPAEAAALWFARLQDEAATAEDWQAFEAWLAAAPEHAQAYERLERIWVELDEAEVAARGALSPRRSGLTRRGWLIGGGAAAASVAAVAIGFSLVSGDDAEAETYATAPGETRTFLLADGTNMRLNADSKATVRQSRRARRVEMHEGEAAFDVTHDPARPFMIASGDQEIRVVGTEFTLRRRDGKMSLTVRRGVVEVRPLSGGRREPTRVRAGERLTHHAGQPEVRVAKVEPDMAFAWTQGQLVYRDAPMSEVAADLSRSLGAPVSLADAATQELRFSGVLALDDRIALARRLEAFAPVKVEPQGRGLLIRKAL